MAGRRVLRGACGGRNNAFTAGNGHHPGATPGTREEPGDRPLARVPGPGGRRAALGEDQATGQPARRGRARPLHLIHGGAVPDSARQDRLARAGTRQPRECRPRWSGVRPSRGEVLGPPRRAGGGNRESRRARNRPVQDRQSASPQDWGPRRREQRRLRGPVPWHRPLPAGDQLLNPVVDGDRRLPLRLVAVVAQAEGQRWRRLSLGSLSVSRTRRRRDHGERDSRQAAGDAGRLSCRACGEYPVPAVGGDVSQAQARSAPWVSAASRNPRHADPLPASPARERGTGFAVHNHVDHLCKTAPGLCAHWGNAGDRVTGAAPATGPSPGKARSTPCGRRRKRNCPHATPQ